MKAKPAFPTTYRFSTGFKVFILGAIPFFGLMTCLAIYVGWMDRPDHPYLAGVLAMALLFALLGAYCVYVAFRLPETITLDQGGITQRRAGGEEIHIRWNEIAVLRDRAVWGRLEVHSIRPGVVIHIEHQLGGYADLVLAVAAELRRRAAATQNSAPGG